jgi:N6-adenosine-specific RNA methylase IME4
MIREWPFEPLRMFGYDVIVADPPWRFKRWSETNQSKGASSHYETMDIAAIKALPVGQADQGRATVRSVLARDPAGFQGVGPRGRHVR